MSSMDVDPVYFAHFERQVRKSLPSMIHFLSTEAINSPPLRYAILCLSASNMSTLDSSLHSRNLPKDLRRSVTSPRTNLLHSRHARRYCALSREQCLIAERTALNYEPSLILTAKVLLAYYHHASTNHLQFRLAVWETVRFVWENQETLVTSSIYLPALRFWYRLCASHRLSKPPALFLEGEGLGSFSPNLSFPGSSDHIYLKCVLGMSMDDLVYDIVIKTLELRSRFVAFLATACVYDIPVDSPCLGRLAYEELNRMLGRSECRNEGDEAGSCFARGEHLVALMKIQENRLQLWRSMLRADQVPQQNSTPEQHPRASILGTGSCSCAFSRHRDAMNYLYHDLCMVVFESVNSVGQSISGAKGPLTEPALSASKNLIPAEMFSIIDTMDLKQSNLDDIYTFSLTEILVQLSLCVQSVFIFDHVLDVIWPRIEAAGRGYENSHVPTHLAKRRVAMMADEWSHGRRVLLCTPAVAEETPKSVLLDPDQQIDMAVYGRDQDGGFFVRRIPLP